MSLNPYDNRRLIASRIVDYSNALICRICECETNQNDLSLEQNAGILKRLRAVVNILVRAFYFHTFMSRGNLAYANDNYSIFDNLFSHLSALQIDVNDNLPKFICQTCVNDLNHACQFQMKCVLTDAKFKLLINAGMVPERNVDSNNHNRSPRESFFISNNIAERNTNNMVDPTGPIEAINNSTFPSEENTIEMVSTQIHDDEWMAPAIQNNENTDSNGSISSNLNVDFNNRMDMTANEKNTTTIEQSVVSTNKVFQNTTSVSRLSNKRNLTEADATPSKRCRSRSFDTSTTSRATTYNVTHTFSTVNIQNNTTTTLESQDTNNLSCGSQSGNDHDEQSTSTEKPASEYSEYDAEEATPACDKTKRLLMEKPLFECHICLRNFRNECFLNRHMKVHIPFEGAFECEICKMFFTQRYYFLDHKLMHSYPYQYLECKTCNKTYTTRGNLNKHRKDHLVSPFLCDICKKMFKSRREIMRHMRIHTKQNTHTCDVCQKSLGSQKRLQAHILRHSKPTHDCNICNKKFKSILSLKNHNKLHKKMPFMCDICKKLFNSKRAREIHMQMYASTST